MTIKKTLLAVASLAVLAINNYVIAGSTQQEQYEKVLTELEKTVQEQENARRIQEIVIPIVGLGLAGGIGYFLLRGLPTEQRNLILARSGVVVGAYISIVHILPAIVMRSQRGAL